MRSSYFKSKKGNFSGDPLDPPRQELENFDDFLNEVKSCAQNIRSHLRMVVDAPVPLLQRLEKFFPEEFAGGVTVALLREELTSFAEAYQGKDSAIDGVINMVTDLQSKNVRAKEALEKVVGSWNEAAHYSQKVEGLRDSIKGMKGAEKLQRNEQKKHDSEQAFQASMGEAASVLSKVLSQQWVNTVELLAELCKFYTSVFQSGAKLSEHLTELGEQFAECKGSEAMKKQSAGVVSEVWTRVEEFLDGAGGKRPLHGTAGAKRRGGAWASLDNDTGMASAVDMESDAPMSKLASSRRFSTLGVLGLRSKGGALRDEESDLDSPGPVMGQTVSAPVGGHFPSSARPSFEESRDELLAALKESGLHTGKTKSPTNNSSEKKEKKSKGETTPKGSAKQQTSPFGAFGGFEDGGSTSSTWGQWPSGKGSANGTQDAWGNDAWPSSHASVGSGGWDNGSAWGSAAGSSMPSQPYNMPSSGRPSLEPGSGPPPSMASLPPSGRPSMDPCGAAPLPISGRPSMEPPLISAASGRPSLDLSSGWGHSGDASQGAWTGESSSNPFSSNSGPASPALRSPLYPPGAGGPSPLSRHPSQGAPPGPPPMQRGGSGGASSPPPPTSPCSHAVGAGAKRGQAPGAGPPSTRRSVPMGGPVPGSAVGYSPWGPVSSGPDAMRRSASHGSPTSPQGPWSSPAARGSPGGGAGQMGRQSSKPCP
mmetsp:Transcript_63005/g.150078  ORF Transcript_63005/g.150078 Transcript_63005/m.150078 type:complete len:707 (+) Transcript_63005:164-2284(+)